MANAHGWFRLYNEFSTDAKVQSMSEAMQRRLVMLFCLRSCDVLRTLREHEMAFALHVTEQELADTKALFIDKQFIDEEWKLLNWDKRQYVSDSSTDRTRKYRERQRTSQERHRDAKETKRDASVTPPDSDTDSDTDIKEPPSEVRKRAKSAHRPTAQFSSLTLESLPDEYADYSQQSHGWDRGRSESVFAKFRDHHLANGSTMKNWLAAWRLWCRNECTWEKQAEARNGHLSLFQKPIQGYVPSKEAPRYTRPTE